MKRILYSTIIIAALSLFMTSCSEDWLDTNPTDQVGSADAFTTTGKALGALNGIHEACFSSGQTRAKPVKAP